jgi:metal-responsive CopG/Arc/MetJ family transcriptional regulator
MSQRTTKTVTISLPPKIVSELDRVRRNEHRSRSEVMYEALRQYIATAGSSRTLRVEEARPDETKAIRQGREDYERGETVSLEDLQHELGLPVG